MSLSHLLSLSVPVLLVVLKLVMLALAAAWAMRGVLEPRRLLFGAPHPSTPPPVPTDSSRP
jgi:hypothetical protein